MWTANHQRKGYMTITAHFVDQNWNLQSRIMRFIYVPCPHTADVLADVLYDSLGDGIKRIRESVAFWTASAKREQRFDEAARQLEISSTKKLELDCKTRWNSTYLMLSVAIIYKDVFKRLKIRELQYKCLPNERDWELAKEVCDKLQVFYEVTLMFSGLKYPTTNVLFPSICEIGYLLREWADSSVEVISSMASKMLEKFDKYWSVINGVMGMVAVLDPRFKMKFIELLLPVLYGNEKASSIIKTLKTTVKSLFLEYESTAPSARNNESEGVGPSLSSSGHRLGFKKLLSDIATIASEHDDSGGTIELDNYYKEKLLPENMELDLLLWWKTNGFKYPTLQRIAKDILAILVSTVASESAFSTSGRLISPHRSRLRPKTLEALMCSQSWLLNDMRETCSNETEAYCRTIEYDYDDDDDQESTKEGGTAGLEFGQFSLSC